MPPLRDELLCMGPAASHVLAMPEQELHVKSNLSAITQVCLHQLNTPFLFHVVWMNVSQGQRIRWLRSQN